MGLVKKLKDILFEEEEEFTQPIKVREETTEEAPKVVKIEPEVEEKEVQKETTSERELFRNENSFQFPEFDEEEFSSMARPKPKANVLEYERKKTVEKRTDYGRYERIETREYTEKKKFKPSPIISPVYGILNQDYKAEDIVNKKDSASNIDIEAVRKKAFEPKQEEVIETIDEPVVTFFEEKDTIKIKEVPTREEYRSIDDLLEDASDEISLEDTLEIPKTNNLDAIEEELEKLDTEEKTVHKDLDDTLDSDLFELIDSMYDEREEGE
ncbi:MAG: hypothetical protein E7161_01590 [Firmicutes bacterium]|nr:hypothetical protein [Bacillota bacterium]